MAKVYQLAFDEREYGENAGRWIVVSDDAEEELSRPMTEDAARALAARLSTEAIDGNEAH